MSELWQLGALDIGRRIAAGQCSAVEVLEAHLARVDDINPRVNAITAVDPERSRVAAAAADERRRQGRALSALDGVPFSTKENLDCVGAATTEGVRALADNVVDVDAPVVERLRSAGAIPFARTNMPDFGLRIHTDNELHGPTINPWNRDRTSGGSSGGEGVALATGMSPMGVGNDIGGSVRNPAYCAGVVSHKPTPHRLPRASVTPPTSWGPAKQLMSVNGPMARRVGDLQAMFSLMHGRHRRDPWSVSAPFQPRQSPGRVRVVANVPGGSTDPQIAAGCGRRRERSAMPAGRSRKRRHPCSRKRPRPGCVGSAERSPFDGIGSRGSWVVTPEHSSTTPKCYRASPISASPSTH